MKHDKCRNTNRYPSVGQNLAYIRDTRPIEVKQELQGMVQKWFNEYQNATQADIDNFQSSDRKIGHFTQMIRDRQSYVGCGVAMYGKEGVKGNHLLLACDYSYANMIGEPVYKSGPKCSECRKCDSINKGLCSENET